MSAAPGTLLSVQVHSALAATYSVRANVVWALAGNAFYLASQWLVLMVVAKMGNPEMVGQLSLAFAITAPIFLLSNLRLRTVLATDVEGEYSLDVYLNVRILMTLAAIAATAFLLMVGSGGSPAVLMCVASAKAFESGSDLLYGFFQLHGRTSRVTTSVIVRGFLSILSVVLATFYWKNATGAAAALWISSIILLLFCDIPMARELARLTGVRYSLSCPDWAAARRLAAASFPLGLSAMLMSFGAGLPRYFIERTLGTHDVGIFSAIWYLAMASGYAVSAIAEGASPQLGRLYSSSAHLGLMRLTRQLLAAAAVIGLLVVAVSVLGGKALLAGIYNRDYEVGWRLLIWLSLAGTLANAASVLSYSLVAVRKYRDHLVALGIMAATTAVGCGTLLPKYGLNGAACALMFGYLGQSAWGIAVLSRVGIEQHA